MMWTSCRVNSKLRPNWAVIRKNKRCYILAWLLGPIASILVVVYYTHPCQTEYDIFSKKHLWNLTKGVLFSFTAPLVSCLVFCQQCSFDMGSPTVASLITSISASAAHQSPQGFGKIKPKQFDLHRSWWHNVGGLNYPVTRDSASLKISSSKQHTAGTSCILSWLSWWMFKPSIHVRVQYLLFCWMNSPFTVQPQMSPIKTVHLPTKNDSLTWLLDHKILDHAGMPRSIV